MTAWAVALGALVGGGIAGWIGSTLGYRRATSAERARIRDARERLHTMYSSNTRRRRVK